MSCSAVALTREMNWRAFVHPIIAQIEDVWSASTMFRIVIRIPCRINYSACPSRTQKTRALDQCHHQRLFAPSLHRTLIQHCPAHTGIVARTLFTQHSTNQHTPSRRNNLRSLERNDEIPAYPVCCKSHQPLQLGMVLVYPSITAGSSQWSRRRPPKQF